MSIEQFRELYWIGFANPKIKVNRVWQLFTKLEIIADCLGGPLYNVYEKGNCDYVYRDNESRFPRVTNADTFRNWALDLVAKYRKGIEAFVPENQAEEIGRNILLQKAEFLAELVELAYQILKSREECI